MLVLALVRKELELLLRDWHGLALLFVMPVVFILVMSLALQNSFAQQQGVHTDYYLVNDDGGAASRDLTQQLAAIPQLRRRPSPASVAELTNEVKRGAVQFLVHIPEHFWENLDGDAPTALQVVASPDVAPAVYEFFGATLRRVVDGIHMQQALAELKTRMPALASQIKVASANDLVQLQSLYQSHGQNERPSSVQQNVPAWLLFAMFFIAIPLSTTWMSERRQGTDTRLVVMGLGRTRLMLGKLIPYLGINLLQVALMLAVGVWVMPLFGADSLTLGQAPIALGLMALAASFAAVCFGLLVASLVSTSEQATIFTGVANLLMAAVGGIMVPRFVMPEAMQSLSHYSPMAWGLDGFLDIFLRQGGLAAVAPEMERLAGFGLVCLVLAVWRPRLSRPHWKRQDHGQGSAQT